MPTVTVRCITRNPADAMMLHAGMHGYNPARSVCCASFTSRPLVPDNTKNKKLQAKNMSNGIDDPSEVCQCTWYEEGATTKSSGHPVIGETSKIAGFGLIYKKCNVSGQMM